MRPEVIDKLADAGVATVNLAVDAWDVKPGLPKAMVPIRSYFDYLVKKQYKYGYSVFLNINICHNNMDDVRQLTELAHDSGIATDYHICESPMTEQPHFKHLYTNPTFIREEDHPLVAELVDWLIEKQKSGYHMVNSVERLAQMKEFIQGELDDWNCRAGHNSLIVRVDGTLAPCFPMYSAGYDWGTIENHKFETKQLKEMKKECQKNCFSTLNHILAFCYNDRRVITWLLRAGQAWVPARGRQLRRFVTGCDFSGGGSVDSHPHHHGSCSTGEQKVDVQLDALLNSAPVEDSLPARVLAHSREVAGAVRLQGGLYASAWTLARRRSRRSWSTPKTTRSSGRTTSATRPSSRKSCWSSSSACRRKWASLRTTAASSSPVRAEARWPTWSAPNSCRKSRRSRWRSRSCIPK